MSPALAIALSLLAALVLLNTWATRRVLRSHEFGNRKALMVMGIWILPILGAFMARYQFAPPASSESAALDWQDPGSEQPPAPEVLHIAGLAPFEVQDHLSTPDDLPLMD